MVDVTAFWWRKEVSSRPMAVIWGQLQIGHLTEYFLCSELMRVGGDVQVQRVRSLGTRSAFSLSGRPTGAKIGLTAANCRAALPDSARNAPGVVFPIALICHQSKRLLQAGRRRVLRERGMSVPARTLQVVCKRRAVVDNRFHFIECAVSQRETWPSESEHGQDCVLEARLYPTAARDCEGNRSTGDKEMGIRG